MGVMDDVFASLVSSRLALDAVAEMMALDSSTTATDGDESRRNAPIWAVVVSNVPKVVAQFEKEIRERSVLFDEEKAAPPISGDLPPISGSIYWARGIVEELQGTMAIMTKVQRAVMPEAAAGANEVADGGGDDATNVTAAVKKVVTQWRAAVRLYEDFCRRLLSFTLQQYKEWCERVSDILAQNLTRPLLTVSDDPLRPVLRRYKVNFTSDLSDTLAEVRHLEALGFEVPEVARNMSNQKARLTSVADSLEAMLVSYHECIDSLSGAEVGLLSSETQKVTQALSSGHLRLTWNNQAIQESCLDIGQTRISIFNYKIQQASVIAYL